MNYINLSKDFEDYGIFFTEKKMIHVYKTMEYYINEEECKMTDKEIIEEFLKYYGVEAPDFFNEDMAVFCYKLMNEHDFAWNDALKIIRRMYGILKIDNFDCDPLDCLVFYNTIEDCVSDEKDFDWDRIVISRDYREPKVVQILER